jgi:hypothetical protein
MTDRESLEAELVRAGRSVQIDPVPDDLATEVLAALLPLPSPRRRLGWWHWLRARRRRLVAAVVIALLLVAALTPPVRAAVVEWLRIGGVLIMTGAPPAGTGSSSPGAAAVPAGARAVSLEEARGAVGFPVGVPSELGQPERITVTADRRVVGMDWTVDGNPVHLDQLDGTLSYAFLKRHWSIVTPTEVDGADAAWLAEPHEIVYVDRTGVERPETARLSGPSLVWQPRLGQHRTTARLEGLGQLEQARQIAESLR